LLLLLLSFLGSWTRGLHGLVISPSPDPGIYDSQSMSNVAPPPKKPTVRPVASGSGPSTTTSNPDPFTTGSIPPSMRTPLRTSQSAEDPRQAAQSAVRQAAQGAFNRPNFDRGPLPPTPTRSPFTVPNRKPGRYDVDIDVENGFTYVDIDEPKQQSPTRKPYEEVPSARTSRPVTRTEPGEASSDPGPGRGRGASRSRSRGGSFGSGKPKGLSFYDAREYMRSGRGSRPGSWQEAPNGAAAAAARAEASGGRSGSRSRSRSPGNLSPRSRSPYDVEEGISPEDLEHDHDHDHDNIPPSPPPHGNSQHAPIPPENMKSRLRRALFPSSSAKSHLVATLGELLGTTMFLFFAFAATEVASVNSPDSRSEELIGFNLGKLLYISFAFGFSLMVNVWIFFGVSEGLFNPAVWYSFIFK